MKKLPDIHAQPAEWYNEIVYEAELVDHSPVRGMMVIRPYGYSIWENIVAILDDRIKKTGHHNAAFPLLIPQSFITKEAKHVEGFAPELAVVTHAGGKELEEPLVVRPTSETVIHYMFARWLRSWRDLPIKVNQWCSVVRWEMRTRPFLRTTEFFWQEGHTAHETEKEALEEVLMMLAEYVHLAEHYLAIPVVAGKKSESEKFPGADITYTFEGLMHDGKALQMGTSHMISQSFAKSFEMQFQDRNGNLAYPYLTSWAVTTRLIGALVMTHGDNKGLVLPPRIAPIQVVIIPILKKGSEADVLQAAAVIAEKLRSGKGLDAAVRVHIDQDETKTPGAKFYHWEMKGVPLRIELGARDIEAGVAIVSDRLGLVSKEAVKIDDLPHTVHHKLDVIQNTLFERAVTRRAAQWHKVAKLSDFEKSLEERNGFYQAGWCGNASCEALLKERKATIRCIVEDKQAESCFGCDKKSIHEILIAKAY